MRVDAVHIILCQAQLIPSDSNRGFPRHQCPEDQQATNQDNISWESVSEPVLLACLVCDNPDPYQPLMDTRDTRQENEYFVVLTQMKGLPTGTSNCASRILV
jgi:hypothetical protein